MYFSGFMVGFLMGLASEVFHSHTGVPTATPGAKPLGCSAPHGTVSPQQAPQHGPPFQVHSWTWGVENAANNEPKRRVHMNPLESS